MRLQTAAPTPINPSTKTKTHKGTPDYIRYHKKLDLSFYMRVDKEDDGFEFKK